MPKKILKWGDRREDGTYPHMQVGRTQPLLEELPSQVPISPGERSQAAGSVPVLSPSPSVLQSSPSQRGILSPIIHLPIGHAVYQLLGVKEVTAY